LEDLELILLGEEKKRYSPRLSSESSLQKVLERGGDCFSRGRPAGRKGDEKKGGCEERQRFARLAGAVASL